MSSFGEKLGEFDKSYSSSKNPVGSPRNPTSDSYPEGLIESAGSRISEEAAGGRRFLSSGTMGLTSVVGEDITESEHKPSNVPNEQLDRTAREFHSTSGGSDAGEEGGSGAIAQLYPDSAPEGAVDSDCGDVAPTGTSGNQGPAALGIGMSTIVIGNTKHENNPPESADSGEEKDGDPAEVLGVGEDPVFRGVSANVGIRASETLGPLKAVLQTILGHSDNRDIITIEDEINCLLSQVVVLEDHFHSCPSGVVEEGHRDEVLCKLRHVEGKLSPMAQEPEGHAVEISGLLGELHETIFNYQMVVQRGIYDQQLAEINPAEKTILNNFCCAPGAEYRHGNRKGCLKGTHITVLNQIEVWSRDFCRSPVYWLNGLAGTGKTTIAQTIAERVFADGWLGASFFCSRDFEDRSNLGFIFPTIATQLAKKYSTFRTVFVPLVQQDTEIMHESLYNQMEKMIVQPLKKSDISTVIIIDALDECKDEESASAILSVLGRFVSEIPKVKFFLTGRPEPRIKIGFHLPLLVDVTDVFVLHNVEPSLIKSDIQLFFEHNFLEIAVRRGGLDDWPPKEDMDLLCKRTGGLFVYAMAIVRFIDHRNNDPREQLNLLLQSPESSTHEGRTKLGAKMTLDFLYTTILQEAFGDDPEDDFKVRSILGAIVLAANPLSPSAIAMLLGFRTANVSLQLSSIHSLLILQEDDNHPVQPFHKSFPDFITDSARCANQRFYVSPPTHHHELLKGCLELMNKTLEKNMCKLPDAVTNSEVGDLEKRVEQYINPALQYACRSWHKHLAEHTTNAPTVGPAIDYFLREKFVFWLEILSILGALREAVDALKVVAKWLKGPPTLDLAKDCFQFVTRFFEIISISAPHIYHSAIPLSPKMSLVQAFYQSYSTPFVKLVHGAPISWDQTAATVKHTEKIVAVAWSPCSRFIALAPASTSGIQVLDAITLKQLSITSPIPIAADGSGMGMGRKSGHLVFSPDGKLLTVWKATLSHIISWDIQTGGLISSIKVDNDFGACQSIAYSECGTMIGTLFTFIDVCTIRIFDITTGTPISSGSFEGKSTQIWTHNGYLHFDILGKGLISTLESPFTLELDKPLRVVQSLPAPDSFDACPESAFHHTLSYLAFSKTSTVEVWDLQNSRPLLNPLQQLSVHNPTLSPSGLFFACTATSNLIVWKRSPTGYESHQEVPCISGENLDSMFFTIPHSLVFSPNEEFVLVHYGSHVIQLFQTTAPASSLSSDSTSSSQNQNKNFLLDFSPDETLAVVARHHGKIITVLDLKADVPQLIINADEEVLAVKVVKDAVLVVCQRKVYTWNIPKGEDLVGCGVDVSHSTWSTTFRSGFFPDAVSISPDSHCICYASAVPCHLNVDNVVTGEELRQSIDFLPNITQFTPDGNEVWCYSSNGQVEGRWKILKEGGSNSAELVSQEATENPPIHPWQSACGYEVTADGWILSPTRKKLFWLPQDWQLGETRRRWSKHHLALLYGGLPKPIIIDLEPKE